MEHSLQYEWTFWSTRTNVIKQVRSAEMWTQKVANIYTVTSIEEFWSVFNNLKNPSQLPTRGDYFFFKKGINPAWEDPVNAQGGAWQVTIPNPLSADDIWTDLLIALVGCQFQEGMEEICGTALGSRKNGIRLAVWTKGTEAAKVVPLGNMLKREVVKTKEPLVFQKHLVEGTEGPLFTAE